MSAAPTPGLRRLACAAILLTTLALAAACGDDTEPTPTPKTIIEGNAVQIFVKEGVKIGWFNSGDDVQLESEPLLFAEALAKAEALDLSLYPSIPGTPPYPDGLPGWLITAQGDFFDLPDNATPNVDTPRRPAAAAAFVDTTGRLTYSMRFTDVTPAPETPRETLPPAAPTN
jgi:hypothetical protein